MGEKRVWIEGAEEEEVENEVENEVEEEEEEVEKEVEEEEEDDGDEGEIRVVKYFLKKEDSVAGIGTWIFITEFNFLCSQSLLVQFF